MKKIKGFVDPFTLGFIITGVIAAGATLSEKNHMETMDAEQHKVEVVQIAVKENHNDDVFGLSDD